MVIGGQKGLGDSDWKGETGKEGLELVVDRRVWPMKKEWNLFLKKSGSSFM